MKKALVLDTEGNFTTTDLTDGDEYKNLVRIVGGYIQAVPFTESITLWVNEEGKMDRLPENSKATKIWEHFYGKTDFIVGNAVFTGGTDEKGDTIALSDNAEELLRYIVRDVSNVESMV